VCQSFKGKGTIIMAPPNNRHFLTQSEAAEFLRLSSRTLERHRIAGTGARFVKMGRRVFYRLSDLENWATERTFSSTSEADAAGAVTGVDSGGRV
jgi:hypothetical protein